MAQDWFRRQTWTESDVADFETRLRRAHLANRAQYLRVQAVHLFQTGQTESVEAALSLANRVLTEYPGNMQVPPARHLRAQCLEHLGDLYGALDTYLQAIDDERRIPSLKMDSYLDFAWLVATRKLTQYYGTALRLLDEFGGRAVFPVQRFRLCAAKALVEDDLGLEGASMHARAALAIATETSSGFRYHQDLGLVEHVDPAIEKNLKRIAAG